MPKRRAGIVGHSFCARLKADLTAGINARMAPAFNLEGKVNNVLFLRKGGKCISHVEWIDFNMIQSACPNIVILMIGDNDVFFDTDCMGLAGRLVSLVTIVCNRSLSQYMIITRLMPCFGIPRCLLDRIQGNTMREKDRYLSMYYAKIDLINMEQKHSIRAFRCISFWNHNGKFDSDCTWMHQPVLAVQVTSQSTDL